jgi:hypothetical protein
MHEASLYEWNYFITLTYSEVDCPWHGGLVYQDLTDFIKRLRSWCSRSGRPSPRYFAAGEYGEKLGRPHFHLCVFNLDLRDLEYWSSRNGHRVYVSHSIGELWTSGLHEIGSLTFQSAGYVARYCMKKVKGDVNSERHYAKCDPETGELIQVEREQVRMSRRPGIGSRWFGEFRDDCFPSDFLIVEGNRVKVPRYYDKELDKISPEELARYKELRCERAKLVKDNCTPARLKVREHCTRVRVQRLQRSLT